MAKTSTTTAGEMYYKEANPADEVAGWCGSGGKNLTVAVPANHIVACPDCGRLVKARRSLDGRHASLPHHYTKGVEAMSNNDMQRGLHLCRGGGSFDAQCEDCQRFAGATKPHVRVKVNTAKTNTKGAK